MTTQCPKCKAENPDTKSFCGDCGTQLNPQKDIPAQTKTLVTPPQELSRGTTIAGRYEIIEQLGTGGMGSVYRVEDKKIHEDVALKLIKPEIAADKKTIERFSNELKVARKIAHRNVCKMYDIGESEGAHFITMEYVPGEDLKSFMRRSKQLSIPTVLSIAKQICGGLDEAHKLAIIHRDLKPSNLMIDKDGNVHIMDFGIARSEKTEGITGTGVMIGTPEYMSPEQVEGKEVDQRSDLYSFGVILYEMLTGRMPFEGETPLSIARKHANETPIEPKEYNEQISDDLNTIILKCLEKDKEKRYQLIEELGAELSNIEGVIPSRVRVVTKKRFKTKWKNFFLSAGSLSLLAVLIWAGMSLFTGQQKKSIDSIAVLPLRNISGGSDQEIFAEGMTDALIAELGQVSAIRVISWQSVVRYKGSDKPLPEIAQELNVDVLVEGSVLRSEDRVRVTAQLVRADPEEHLWAKTYEHELKDVLLLQSEVAQAIVHEIKSKLTPDEEARLLSTRSINPEAHEAYIKGMFHWNKRTNEDLKESAKYFERALEIDPNYAKAHVGLAMAYDVLETRAIIPHEVARAKGKEAVKKALELDESLGEAHRELASLKVREWDWEGAEREYKQAIALSPSNAWAYNAFAQHLMLKGRFDEAIEMIKKSQELDPLSPINSAIEGYIYFMAREYEKGIAQCQKTLEMDPDFELAEDWLRWNQLEKGMYDEAIRGLQSSSLIKGLTYVRLGKIKEAERVIAEFIARSKTPQRRHSYAALAFLYFALRENDAGFKWLNKAYEEKNYYLFTLKVNPWFDPARSDPRFEEMLNRVGLDKY